MVVGLFETYFSNEEIEVFLGNVHDRDILRTVVKSVDVVFHVAALIAIRYSYRAPASYVETKVKKTLNVLEECRNVEARRLVHTFTSEIYGTAKYIPIDEKHPFNIY